MTVIPLKTVRELVAHTRAWHECHWTHARTDEAAARYFNDRGLKTEGVTVYRLPFGYCYPVKEG